VSFETDIVVLNALRLPCTVLHTCAIVICIKVLLTYFSPARSACCNHDAAGEIRLLDQNSNLVFKILTTLSVSRSLTHLKTCASTDEQTE